MMNTRTDGTIIPMLFKRFRIDPAIATGPFVTTSIDVFSILFYFIIAVYPFLTFASVVLNPDSSGCSCPIHRAYRRVVQLHPSQAGILPRIGVETLNDSLSSFDCVSPICIKTYYLRRAAPR